MSAYYGYKRYSAEDNEKVNIDWSAIAKNIGDKVVQRQADREAKRKKIEDDSAALGEYIANTPLGDHKGAVAITADLAAQVQDIRLMQDKLLRDGLPLRDYNTMRANTKKDIETLYKASADFQKLFKEDLERTQNGQSQLLEVHNNAQLQGFLNPDKVQYLFDPDTGRLMVGQLDENGVPIQDSFMPMQAIQNQVHTRLDKFDVVANVSNITKQLPGKFGQVVMSGDVKRIKGIINDPDFEAALDNTAESMIVNDYNAASVLTDNIGFKPDGTPWTIEDFVASEEYNALSEEEKLNKIELIPNSQDPSSGVMEPRLSDEQREIAKEYIKSQFLLSIGLEEEARKDPREVKPTAAETQAQIKKDQDKEYFTLVTKLVTDDPTSFESTARTLIQQANEDVGKGGEIVQSIERGPDRIVITYESDAGVRKEEISTVDKTAEEVSIEIASFLTPIENISAVAGDVDFEGIEFNVENAIGERGQIVEEVEPISSTMFLDDANKAVQGDVLFDSIGGDIKQAAKVVNRVLTTQLEGAKIKVKGEDDWGSTNTLYITVNGKEYQLEYDNDGMSLMNEIQEIVDEAQGKEFDVNSY